MKKTVATTSEPFFHPSAGADGCPPGVSATDRKWFVLRATYSRELKARGLLQEAGADCFIPMLRQRDDDGWHYVPAVHNLIFVHCTRTFMDTFKMKVEGLCPLRYMMDRSTGLPMVVRDKEMEDFKKVCDQCGDSFFYLNDPSAVVRKGTPVEIVDGPLRGVSGRLLRVRRDRKVALQLAGVVAIAADGIPMEYCRIIEE